MIVAGGERVFELDEGLQLLEDVFAVDPPVGEVRLVFLCFCSV